MDEKSSLNISRMAAPRRAPITMAINSHWGTVRACLDEESLTLDPMNLTSFWTKKTQQPVAVVGHASQNTCISTGEVLSKSKWREATNAEAASTSLAIWLYCCWSLSGTTSSQSNPLSHRDEINFLAGTRTGEIRPIGSGRGAGWYPAGRAGYHLSFGESHARRNYNGFPWKL